MMDVRDRQGKYLPLGNSLPLKKAVYKYPSPESEGVPEGEERYGTYIGL